MGDLQPAWCLQPRPNVGLRSVPRELSGGEFAAGVACVNFSTSTRTQSTTQLKRKVLFRWQLEELGLRSVERLRHAAHNLGVLKALSSVPSVAANFIVALEAGEATPSIQSVLSCIDNFAEVGFVVPAWEVVVANSLHDEEEEVEGDLGGGFCYPPAHHLPSVDDQETLLRSQAGPMAFAPFIAAPSMKETRIDPQPFRLLAPFAAPFAPSSGLWPSPRRPWPPPCRERMNVAARVCQETGGRVRTNLRCVT